MLDIVGRRYLYYLISAVVVVPGLISLILFGLNFSIDFTGGSILELQFEQAVVVQPAQLKELFGQYGFGDTMVQSSPGNIFLIRSKTLDAGTKGKIQQDLEERFGSFTELRFESVGPAVGGEVQRRAYIVVGMAAVAILIYISFAFRHVMRPVRYGTCAIIAMVHDIFVVVGLASILGWVRGFEVDALFLTALLTVIGFSVHDSIVVFDRIRENSRRYAGQPVEDIVNHSIIQTLDRSINTQLTVVFTLTALLLFGGITIRSFVLTLLIGIISGTYSSIFNASPLLVEWERRPDLLLYALSALIPPAGLIIGLLLLFRGSDTSRPWARGCLLAALAGAVVITGLLLLRGVIHS
ncbi:MAG: protein translocase subunit SecF [Anaerolineae bacterium]|nr:protein translocase subunit SecF [Anaerolineae bacterium]NIN98900.1 protein translocase subunit SecF [Anaerolineae bacterium]NIQ81811.1 protein translocase subunit SecF [Anaerolineae bacterium]